MTLIIKYVYLRGPNTHGIMRTCTGKSILFTLTSYILRNDPRDATLGQGWRYYLKF